MTKSADNLISPSPALNSVAQGETLNAIENNSGLLSRVWRWLNCLQIGRAGERRLRVADTVSLGEKRFVAVVQVDGRHFLLAGGPTNIALLAQLNEKDDFGDVLKQTMTPAAAAAALAPPPPPQEPQEEIKPTPQRAARARKKVAPPAAPASPTREKPAAQIKKTAKAAVKKQPTVAAKRSNRPAAGRGRFGDIPPADHQGVRAFEKWLGRAVPITAGHTASSKADPHTSREPASEKANAPTPLPVKQTLNEWLQETRPLGEKTQVQTINQPVVQPNVEEYA